ncbi:MAG: CDP-diacylglycerol--glycerol-3-phosphate 3-phosphatidyltransferase [Proteobacteria bacterium]|nr:CDP-diacylglycerol--glycerol-3-phosphate 3-phosphatidyltransferase [Pseudomonadota bacterium]
MFNIPNILTMARIAAIPLIVVAYYLPYTWANDAAAVLFILAAVTDWLDGYLARKWDQTSPFGAFLDPVADKLMVAAALVLLVADSQSQAMSISPMLLNAVVIIILGREITISALREWMAELGKRSNVAVSFIGKLKTAAQMTAIPVMLIGDLNWFGYPCFRTGEILLYIAAALTLWSMMVYLKAAWPALKGQG